MVRSNPDIVVNAGSLAAATEQPKQWPLWTCQVSATQAGTGANSSNMASSSVHQSGGNGQQQSGAEMLMPLQASVMADDAVLQLLGACLEALLRRSALADSDECQSMMDVKGSTRA